MYLLRTTLIFILLAVAVPASFAQTGGQPTTGSVKGKLTDGKNPLSYATVTLLRTDSTVVNGDLSKDDGSFKIAPTGIGSFILRIEYVGVASKFMSVQVTPDQSDKDLGNIKLVSTESKLKEVDVVGEKPIMELKVDKKVFNVEKNTTTAGGSASDVLQNVPSVQVDADGNVSLRGNSSVTVLIDGKPATLLGSDVASALQSLSASSIESVEVVTNPSAKYDAQGTGGIINIITKKDGRFGMNGNVTLGAGTNDKYNANFGLNARKGKWNVFVNGSYRENHTYNNVITNRHTDSASFYTYEHVPRVFKGFFSTVGASYDPDKYNSLTLTENVNVMSFGYNDNSTYNTYSTPNYTGAIDSTQNKYTNFKVSPVSLSSSLDYKHKFKKKDEELNVDATFAVTTITRVQNYTTINTPQDAGTPNPIFENSPATGGNNSLNVWADYTDPLFTKNGKLGLGFKSQFYNFNSSGNPTISYANGTPGIDYSLISDYNYSQQIHAAYVNWSDQLGKFSYQLGLRGEDAIYNGNGKLPSGTNSASDTSFKNSFVNLFPSAFISYQLPNQQSIYLNYSRRTNRPNFQQLLPFIDLSNPGVLNTGNPALLPEFINNIEFSYNKLDNKGNNIILGAYYAYTQNLIDKVTQNITTAEVQEYGVSPGILFSRPINLTSGSTYGAEATGHLQLLPIWDATINANFFENVLNVPAEYNLGNTSGFAWFSKLNTNLKLPANISLQVNVNYESPKVVAQGTIRESYWMDVALRKNFFKNKATLVLNCSDVFKTRQFITDYTAPFIEEYNRIKETRIGNISFTYRFGKSDLGKAAADKHKPDDKKKLAPEEEDREKNMKSGDDNDQNGGGGQGGAPAGGNKGNGGGGGAGH
jgi:outer membrane receptor protein involved in Fe transport